MESLIYTTLSAWQILKTCFVQRTQRTRGFGTEEPKCGGVKYKQIYT